MHQLPNPSELKNIKELMAAFHDLSLQAEDQAKSVVKNGHVPAGCQIPYLLFIGPYWAFQQFGPFDTAQLTVRHHKYSDSGDYEATKDALRYATMNPPHRKLYLLGMLESARKLEEIISSSDTSVTASIQEAQGYNDWPLEL